MSTQEPTGARYTMTGSIHSLRRMRDRYRKLRDAVDTLGELGFADDVSSAVLREVGTLRDTYFAVTWTCLLCKQPTPVEVRLTGTDEPSAVICGTCSWKIDHAVAAMNAAEAGEPA